MKSLNARACAKRIVGLAARLPTLRIGGHAQALVAPQAKRLVAVARRTIRNVPPRVHRVQAGVVHRMEIRRTNDTRPMTLRAFALFVTGEAGAFIPSGGFVLRPEGGCVGVDSAQGAAWDENARREIRAQASVRQRGVTGRATRGRLLSVMATETQAHLGQLRRRREGHLLDAGMTKRTRHPAVHVQLVVEFQRWRGNYDSRRFRRLQGVRPGCCAKETQVTCLATGRRLTRRDNLPR